MATMVDSFCSFRYVAAVSCLTLLSALILDASSVIAHCCWSVARNMSLVFLFSSAILS
jgi:hypothetical protein